MRLILLSVVVLLYLSFAFALEINDGKLKDLLGVADQGDAHAESGARLTRGYGHGNYGGGNYGGGNYGRGNYGHGHHGHGHGGHYGR